MPSISGATASTTGRCRSLAAAYALGPLTLTFGGLGGFAAWQSRNAAVARDVAANARKTAEDALLGEASARKAAEQARDAEAKARVIAEQLQKNIARFEYGRTMEVAHQEWRESSVADTLALIFSTRADLRGWEWRYLHRLFHSDLLTMNGHTQPLNTASFKPQGSRVVTASWDSTAKIWDAKSGAEVLTLKVETHPVGSTSFSPDGSRILIDDNIFDSTPINRRVLTPESTPPPGAVR